MEKRTHVVHRNTVAPEENNEAPLLRNIGNTHRNTVAREENNEAPLLQNVDVATPAVAEKEPVKQYPRRERNKTQYFGHDDFVNCIRH